MKPSPRDNPLTTRAAANHLGLTVNTILAIKRSLGITRRTVFASEIRNFLRKNPNWKVMNVARPKRTESNPIIQQHAVTKSTPVSVEPPAPAPRPAVMSRSHTSLGKISLGKICRRFRKQNKVDVADVVRITGLSTSCVYKLERTGEVSFDVVEKVGRLICKSESELIELVAQWIMETVGNHMTSLRIQILGNDEGFESQMEQIKSIFRGLTPDQRAQIVTSLADKRLLDLLCHLPIAGGGNTSNSN
jgi:hypothetical protein